MRSAIRSVELPDPRADLASGRSRPSSLFRRARASSGFPAHAASRIRASASGRGRLISCMRRVRSRSLKGEPPRRPRPRAECATKLARASASAKRWAVVESDAGDSLVVARVVPDGLALCARRESEGSRGGGAGRVGSRVGVGLVE